MESFAGAGVEVLECGPSTGQVGTNGRKSFESSSILNTDRGRIMPALHQNQQNLSEILK